MLYARIHAKHVKTDPISQQEAKDYVLNRELIRPKTTKKIPIILGILMVVTPIPIEFIAFLFVLITLLKSGSKSCALSYHISFQYLSLAGLSLLPQSNVINITPMKR